MSSILCIYFSQLDLNIKAYKNSQKRPVCGSLLHFSKLILLLNVTASINFPGQIEAEERAQCVLCFYTEANLISFCPFFLIELAPIFCLNFDLIFISIANNSSLELRAGPPLFCLPHVNSRTEIRATIAHKKLPNTDTANCISSLLGILQRNKLSTVSNYFRTFIVSGEKLNKLHYLFPS